MSVYVPGEEGSLITSTLEVTKDSSLRALVICVASNNFARRQSLEAGRLSFAYFKIPPTRMTVCAATGALLTVN